MGRFLDDEHFRELVQSGSLAILPAKISQLASSHLVNHFPIQTRATTSIIDWNRVCHKSLDWANVTDDEAALWSKETLVGKCSMALLFYSENVESVLGPVEFMIRNLDTLIWKAPGCRLLFGVEKSRDGAIVFTDGIIETDGKGHLFASRTIPV